MNERFYLPDQKAGAGIVAQGIPTDSKAISWQYDDALHDFAPDISRPGRGRFFRIDDV